MAGLERLHGPDTSPLLLDLRATQVQAYLQTFLESQAAQECASEREPATQPHDDTERTTHSTSFYMLSVRSSMPPKPAAESARSPGEVEDNAADAQSVSLCINDANRADSSVAASDTIAEAEPPAEVMATATAAVVEPPPEPTEVARTLS